MDFSCKRRIYPIFKSNKCTQKHFFRVSICPTFPKINSGNDANVFIFKSKDSLDYPHWISKKGDSLSGEVIFIELNKGKIKVERISDELGPIVIIDGEEMSPDFDIEKLNVDDIERMEVFKGQKALQKVGDKGKNGVIIIKMKN